MRVRNRSMLFAFLLLIVAVLLPLSACSQPDSQTITLKLAHFFPATHPAETVLVKGWADALKEATDGRIIIESYPGETLAKAPDIYGGVVEGVADIGLSCFAYTPGRFPVLEAFELPGVIYINSRSASTVAWEGIKALNPQEVQDTHLLMVIATGPGDLFTREPVRSLEDLQGMEIRATGISADTLLQLGGVPVGMPQSDTYDALTKGVVKGNLSPVEVLKGWNQAEVTQYITETPFLYNTLFFITMNKQVWASIPADLQEIITDVTEQYHTETAAALWDMQNKEAMVYAIEQHGMEIIPLSDTEAARWIEAVQPIQDSYLQKLVGLGITINPLDTIQELAGQYNEQFK